MIGSELSIRFQLASSGASHPLDPEDLLPPLRLTLNKFHAWMPPFCVPMTLAPGGAHVGYLPHISVCKMEKTIMKNSIFETRNPDAFRK